MRRYKNTITLAAIVMVVLGLFAWQWSESHDCGSLGGQYVWKFPAGWACVR